MCPHCGLEVQDDWHFVWGCPCLATCPDSRIQKSNWLKGEAWRQKDTMPCLYLRGLTPKASTHRNVGAIEAVTSLSSFPHIILRAFNPTYTIPVTQEQDID